MITPISYTFESVIAASKQLPYEVLLEGLSFIVSRFKSLRSVNNCLKIVP